MIVGFHLIVDFDDSCMLGDETGPGQRPFYNWRFLKDGRPHPATCPTCGRKTDPAFISPTFRARHRSWDASCTYDGYYLASKRLRRVAGEHGWRGVEFDPLPADADFFRLRVTQLIEFDSVARQTRFENPCPDCGRFHDVVGATPVRLKNPGALAPDGVYRTDLEFASGHEQHPVVLVGTEIAEQIRAARLRKVGLGPVHSA